MSYASSPRTSQLVGSPTWLWTPGQPRKTWFCQIWTNVGISPGNFWDASLSIVATVQEWRNGPQGLRGDDDDDDDKNNDDDGDDDDDNACTPC